MGESGACKEVTAIRSALLRYPMCERDIQGQGRRGLKRKIPDKIHV